MPITDRQLDQIQKQERAAWRKWKRLEKIPPPPLSIETYPEVIAWADKILDAEKAWNEIYERTTEIETQYLAEHGFPEEEYEEPERDVMKRLGKRLIRLH